MKCNDSDSAINMILNNDNAIHDYINMLLIFIIIIDQSLLVIIIIDDNYLMCILLTMSEYNVEMVKIPKDQYQMMKGKIDVLDKKVQSYKNLDVQLQEKEQNLKWYKDKSHQYETEVSRLEKRLASVMKFQLSPKQHRSQSTTSIGIESVPVTTSNKQTLMSMSSSGFPQAFSLPGISKSMFDNVVRDNIKMKKLLQDALKKDGRDLKSFLEAKEYEDIIKDLRLEIACKNQEITRLNLSQDDVANTSNFYHLQAKVQRLEKVEITYKSTIESLTKQLEEVRISEKILQEQLQAFSSKKEDDICKSDESGFNTINSGDRIISTTETSQKTQEDFVDSKNMETDDVKQLKEERRKQVEKYEQTIQTLQAKIDNEKQVKEEFERRCEEYATTYEELRNSKQQLEMNLEKLHKECEDYKKDITQLNVQLREEMEKNNLQAAQLTVYKEDFDTESSEKKLMRARYEGEISRQQNQIRKLSEECRKLSDMLTEEKQKNQTSRFPSFQFKGAQCGPAEVLPWTSPQRLPMHGLVVDGEATDSPEHTNFKCPRCQKRFNDRDTFLRHTSQCTENNS